MRKLALVLLFSLAFHAMADGSADGIDHSDPNFVKASLMLTSPGRALYSSAGHLFIRLECPPHQLDYCFSYESEAVSERVLSFFAGKLKMGMFTVPTADFLKIYREEHRGVRQYSLNLPPDMKVRLWKVLDDKASQGALLPYDYIRRGCAWAVLSSLREALGPYRLEYPSWPKKYDLSRREIIELGLHPYEWTIAALHAIVGFEGDLTNTNIEKVVMPADLVEFLQHSTINGQNVLSSNYEEIFPFPPADEPPLVTPMMVAGLFLLLAVVTIIFKNRWLNGLFLVVYFLAACFFTYMVCFSHLPATGWNWLIVPFNLLPLIFWHWRRYWAIPYAILLVGWEAFMLLYPHRLTDPAYYLMVMAYVVLLLGNRFLRRS